MEDKRRSLDVRDMLKRSRDGTDDKKKEILGNRKKFEVIYFNLDFYEYHENKMIGQVI